MTKKEETELRRRREAREAERAQFIERRKAAEAVADAATDLDPLADALRALLLAKADVAEYVQGDQLRARLIRRRANSDAYRFTMAAHTLATRLLKIADDATDEGEIAAMHARSEAESRRFLSTINAMVQQAWRASR